MNQQEQVVLLAERSALERMIAVTPETDVIDRRSLEARLDVVNRHLAELSVDERFPARARLTYRGRPVIGSHGIFAQFGMEATKAFADAIALVAAAISGPLSATGPIPGRDQSQLLITSTAVGSFGFELEEHREAQLRLQDENQVAPALDKTLYLLKASTGTDEDLADIAAELDPRAVLAIRSFLETVANAEATCALEKDGVLFAFSDVGQVRRSVERLSQDNLHEERVELEGIFQGVLPTRRTFEFQLAKSHEVIVGKIGKAISDPDSINSHLHKVSRISVMSTRVGNGKPRYMLDTLPVWLGSAGTDPSQGRLISQ